MTESKPISTIVEDAPSINTSNTIDTSNTSIKVANWNLQIFGDNKESNIELMNFYVSKLKVYDIIFVQEIRDDDSSSFEALCFMMPNYSCKISSRAGRSSSKEQYGIIYKKGISLESFKDFNPDSLNRWERPPIEVTFNIDGYNIKVYNIHTKPDDVANELSALEDVVINEGNAAILGDLNADCNYYTNNKQDFSSWYWLIKDNQDTTLSQTDCAYDRLIVNADLNNEILSSGIDTSEITNNISDHYIVWMEIKIK
jgi:endonuclease/exonuclease/phosphatase family metal-dependent hydrolase